uniref:Uncharacterized protein n=1 Tax=Opuntia streptacantha TaxID=393608 RepID=A0A7C9ERV2_OPUST
MDDELQVLTKTCIMSSLREGGLSASALFKATQAFFLRSASGAPMITEIIPCRLEIMPGIRNAHKASSFNSCWPMFSVMSSKKLIACFFMVKGSFPRENMYCSMPIADHLLLCILLSSTLRAPKSCSAAWATVTDIWPQRTESTAPCLM